MAAAHEGSGEAQAQTWEWASYRLDARRIAMIEHVARGFDEGDSGLKSCAPADIAASCGVSKKDAVAMAHGPSLLDDVDDAMNEIGDLLAKGFTFAEVARRVQLGGGETKMLALERFCERVRLMCDADVVPAAWTCSWDHRDRRNARRTLGILRDSPGGYRHYAVLHIVYGWPDPFVRTIEPEARAILGSEFAPLARYTDAVEERRQAMVRAAGQGADLGDVVDLERARNLMDRAERTISSGEALRAALAPLGARAEGETNEQHREHLLAWRAAKATFLSRVRVDANRMLTEASTAFRDAWKRV